VVSVANGMFGRDEKKYIQGFAGEALVPQPAYGYHTTTAKPQRNTNTQ